MAPFQVRTLVGHVDPFVGVTGAGSNVIGPVVPHGSIHPSPNTPGGGTDGYAPTSSVIRGFAQLHVSGTGGNSKYGNILVSPQTNVLAVGETEHDYSKSSELASACQYSVTLATGAGAVRTEVTPSHNAAIYRFTYPESASAFLAFDLAHNIPGDILGSAAGHPLAGSSVNIDGATGRVTGLGKYRGGWADHAYTVYFAAQLSKTPASSGTWKDGAISDGSTSTVTDADSERIGAFFRFATAPDEPVYLKIAVSLQSVANAEAMLASQIPGLDAAQFTSIKSACESAWNNALSTILIDDSTATADQLKLFYTNLFHTMIMPRRRTGDNPWLTSAPYYDDHYADWDTFRSTFPLLTLLKEGTMAEIINSYIARFARDGVVGDAYVSGVNAWIQGGDAVDVVVADAYAKGVAGVDWQDAYAVIKFNANNMRSVGYRLNDRGWSHSGDTFPGLSPGGSAASKTLEFALNDFAVSQVAKGLGITADYERFIARSTRWSNLWRAEATDLGFTGFVTPKSASGTWETINLQQAYDGWGPGGFYEGSSWTYSFFVPHDVGGLISRMGGAATFVNRLDAGFDNASPLLGVSNEPGFLIPWLYNYAGRPDRTTSRVRGVMQDWTLAGYPGDEDSGALGAWYVFAAMGMFPNAGQDLYLLHGPKFRKMTLQRENGSRIVIEGPDASATDALYVQSATLNGAALTRAWLTHTELKNGATLSFVMGPSASTWAASNPPPTPEAGSGGGAPVANLALNKMGSSTSACASAEGVAQAVDGDGSTKWCSNAPGDKWLSLDLGSVHSISRWVVRHAGSHNEPAEWNTRTFRLQASTDDATWTDVDAVDGNMASITDRSFAAVSARYVRLYITVPTSSSDSAARIFEFEIY